jgi:hypothetical protein
MVSLLCDRWSGMLLLADHGEHPPSQCWPGAGGSTDRSELVGDCAPNPPFPPEGEAQQGPPWKFWWPRRRELGSRDEGVPQSAETRVNPKAMRQVKAEPIGCIHTATPAPLAVAERQI